jgi:hypothetical protein
MPCHRGSFHALLILSCVLLVAAGLSGCSTNASIKDQERVAEVFMAWKDAMINGHTDQAMAYVSPHVDVYLATLKENPPAPVASGTMTPSFSPGVDLFLRTALAKKVPADLRASLTLGALLQRIADRHLFNPRDIREIDLGRVSVNGDHAHAELYYQGTLTALRLPFVREQDDWKIDVMAILPYAEVLMRVDRAIKGETVSQQVEQLVSKLPSL